MKLRFSIDDTYFYDENGNLKEEPRSSLEELEECYENICNTYKSLPKPKKNENGDVDWNDNDNFHLGLAEFNISSGIDMLEYDIDLKLLWLEYRKNASKDYPAWDTDKAETRLNSCAKGARLLRQDVYKHNCEIFAAGGYVSENGLTTFIPKDDYMLENTIIYSEEIKLDKEGYWKGKRIEFGVENEDCLTVAKNMMRQDYYPAVLNLADAYTACGYYSRGSFAQEESLCRASTLSRSLYQYYKARTGKADKYAKAANVELKGMAYPMNMNYGGIYSAEVTVFRNSDKQMFSLMDNPFKVDIITVPALDFNEKHGKNLEYQLPDGGINPEGMEIMRNKIRTIYRIAASTGHDSIVLGAFGCGAFRLPCATVASIFKEVLQEEEFNGQFKAIRFAILDKDGPNGKFAPFYEMFNPNSV